MSGYYVSVSVMAGEENVLNGSVIKDSLDDAKQWANGKLVFYRLQGYSVEIQVIYNGEVAYQLSHVEE